MDTLINLYAGATGLWAKVAAFLPLVSGAGSVLVGAGSILLQLSHSGSAAGALNVIKSLNANDPNVILIVGGLTALGIHTNHQQHTAQLAAIAQQAGVSAPQPDAAAPSQGAK